MTKGGTLNDVLTEAKNLFGNRTICGFETIVYHPSIRDDIQRNREFEKFISLPLPQAVCFFQYSVPDFDADDYFPHIVRKEGSIKIFFQIVSLSFLSGINAIEIFANNLHESLMLLSDRNRNAHLNLIFRSCAMSSVKCTLGDENKIFVKIEFNDFESLKLHWRDSLILK